MNMQVSSLSKIKSLLRIRSYLQRISQISFIYSKLNQKYQIDTMTAKEIEEILSFYIDLINDTEKVIKDYKSQECTPKKDGSNSTEE